MFDQGLWLGVVFLVSELLILAGIAVLIAGLVSLPDQRTPPRKRRVKKVIGWGLGLLLAGGLIMFLLIRFGPSPPPLPKKIIPDPLFGGPGILVYMCSYARL